VNFVLDLSNTQGFSIELQTANETTIVALMLHPLRKEIAGDVSRRLQRSKIEEGSIRRLLLPGTLSVEVAQCV
jgi:hypothetical protein